MSTCKATIIEGAAKGIQCSRPASDENPYCGRHQRNKKYDEGVAEGIRWCRFFFRGCDNSINDLPANILSCQACRSSKRIRPKCGHDGCEAQAKTGEEFCGKHLRDKYRLEELEKGIKYCDIDRGCFNICEGERASCSSCLEAERAATKDRLDARRKQNSTLKAIVYNNARICIKCNKDFEAFETSKGNDSHKCPSCYETQLRVELSRAPRTRNFKAERFANMKTHYAMYIHNALQRGKAFPLQFDEFCELCTKPCHYCEYYIEGEVNGIDRINNDIDYEPSNCVPCCEMCNRMKSFYHPSFFIDKAKIMCGQIVATPEFYAKWDVYYKSTNKHTHAEFVNTARKRKVLINLSKEEFTSLIRQSCYLCGYKQRQGIGIDRFDNTIREYTLPNCRPCCASCNNAKVDYEFAAFIGHCAAIAAKWKDTRAFDDIPVPSNPYKVAKTPSVQKQWRAKTLYNAIMSESADEYYRANEAHVSKEEVDALSDKVKTLGEGEGIELLKSFLNTVNKRRTRAALKSTAS